MGTLSQDENGTPDFWRDWDLSDLTEAEYLSKVLGPKYLPPRLVIPLTIAYVVIFITGVFGNVATCTVIIRNSSMQTATNYYLFSLAISDLTLLILGLPNELSVFWQQYPWALGTGLCKIRAYVSEMSSYVSVLTIVAFSMERYLAICHPLRIYSISGLKRPTRFILAVWSIAMVSAIPFAIYTKVNFVEYPPGSGNYSADSAICAMLLPDMPKFPLYELSCIVFFLVPMLVILVVYTRMGLKIKRSTKETLGPIQGSYVHGDHRQVQSRKSVVRMLSAVVIMFFLCWAPFHAQRLLYIYAQDSDYYPDLNEWLYILSGCLYYFSTTVNPILYNLMSIKYRQAFKQTICCRTRRPASKILMAKESHSRRCDSMNEPHDRRIVCSVRHTISQVKEIFCFTPSRQESIKDSNKNNGNASNFPQNAYSLQKEDSSSTFLFERGHLLAHQQPSNESTTSTKRSEDTVSVAKSSL
ncbi:PREDICTED: neuropeptides capa receptor-like [Vollenhovia emeryi]|uniref:neuropeptides capa receptor-like n=1 Tax=Vollenhovia emeryi TaxID=411798 RepID=UPI0005F4C832|nr:PREDICTED: neuropeptides capa receptor-like [Vollenhovia emeryi]XP_011879992.1 PREDICTED: neuropeptides capa receptor-like [Vollenhovia emeryi]XP_011879993.1 PREDICTED: neuropeptides capa receptor-like [Vollenhovia emeryi]XP_011879994.1 PREDICTED: neuropeptides capa receptor-like [Vollenhovia emeryi]XP_011879995.1 PREDICTED: neuropeptides capa receptor-like [Vollenhovia emeryi]XP_011879996.1 PREDICTED: neuropeptides capa receptor-like [Vollenhovia emeryi]